jgi:hypothetical protein
LERADVVHVVAVAHCLWWRETRVDGLSSWSAGMAP